MNKESIEQIAVKLGLIALFRDVNSGRGDGTAYVYVCVAVAGNVRATTRSLGTLRTISQLNEAELVLLIQSKAHSKARLCSE